MTETNKFHALPAALTYDDVRAVSPALEHLRSEPVSTNDDGEPSMTTWPEEEIRKLAETDDLHIAPFRSDGTTYGTPTWIWSVVVDNDLFVRAYNGKASTWYKAALQQKAGRIIAAGMTKQVTF